ncbi:MAG: thioredoxin domain-containing protein [Spirulina sp. DLM2.Bin59]|nr:MAG: thioredoxin domain-containing protein [Spirulina sp. DLM2.Bin59]
MSNRLAQSQSLYLRKHAENPIDWWPWCDAALEKAASEDKPIFLSVGYSSCHWCTVMEGEAFSNEAIAHYLNTHFVPIKVDREERPDLDSIYMQALQMLTGQGGWPLNIWLTPGDRIPFYGGTYFPIQARYGRPAFLDLLQALDHFYHEDKTKLASIQDQIYTALKRSTLLPVSDTPLNAELLHSGINTSTGIIGTPRPGNPSFPMIPYSDLVLAGSRFPGRETATTIAQQRGHDLALGGIYDHVAGGFHRYTVDATWTVPHFEKMLYDNGQIVEYLANLWSAGHWEPAYRRAVVGTIAWLQREMTAPEGYFYAAQDADSFPDPTAVEPEEGVFYIWSYEELSQQLSREELRAMANTFTITPEGNFEGMNVLQRDEGGDLAPEVETALAKLFTRRYGASPQQCTTFPPAVDNHTAKTYPWPGRIPAVTDPKMIAAWNGLMISGLARAAAVFDLPPALALATGAMEFLLNQQWVEGRFHRLNYGGSVSVPAQSEDYAFVIKALLDLYQVEQAERWLTAAIRVQGEFDQHLWNHQGGGYFNGALDASGDLLVRERSYLDNATPAANGVAIANLVRLALVTQETAYLERAEQGLLAFAGIMDQSPAACPSLFGALDWFLAATLVRSDADQLRALGRQFWPRAMYRQEEMTGGAIALVCQGLTCLPPVTTPEQFTALLQKCHNPTLIPTSDPERG